MKDVVPFYRDASYFGDAGCSDLQIVPLMKISSLKAMCCVCVCIPVSVLAELIHFHLTKNKPTQSNGDVPPLALVNAFVRHTKRTLAASMGCSSLKVCIPAISIVSMVYLLHPSVHSFPLYDQSIRNLRTDNGPWGSGGILRPT